MVDILLKCVSQMSLHHESKKEFQETLSFGGKVFLNLSCAKRDDTDTKSIKERKLE